jgi:hypothetical protein
MRSPRLTGLLLLIAGCAPHPAADVPFLVTPPEIADQMLRLARVGPADVVYDLGSGDGRLVIAAAREAATVVTLYLTREVNLRLRPKLLAELGPGTRVVSFNFDMGDWEPAAMLRVDVNGRSTPVYLWVVPPR